MILGVKHSVVSLHKLITLYMSSLLTMLVYRQQKGREQNQVGGHAHQEGNGNQNAQRDSALEGGGREDGEARKQDYGRVEHTKARVADGSGNGFVEGEFARP